MTWPARLFLAGFILWPVIVPTVRALLGALERLELTLRKEPTE